MKTFSHFLPIILILLFFYGIYRYSKSRNDGVEIPTNLSWKKARIVLFILMPFFVIFEVITDEMGGGEIRIIATIINFFVSKKIFLYYNNKSIIQNYPKLSILLISVGVFIIQLMLGQLINS